MRKPRFRPGARDGFVRDAEKNVPPVNPAVHAIAEQEPRNERERTVCSVLLGEALGPDAVDMTRVVAGPDGATFEFTAPAAGLYAGRRYRVTLREI